MARRGRYTSVDNWHRGQIDFVPFGISREAAGLVTLDICDVREVNGQIWHDGCHRITVKGPPGRPRSKTFIGEFAWADAQRYGADAVEAVENLLRDR